MKKRKFADGGETTEMRPSATPALDEKISKGGHFDEDTYARARRFVESGGKKEETKTAVKKARKVEVDPTAGEAKEGKAAQRAAYMMETAEDRPTYKKTAGGIPIDPNPPKAPASTGEDTSGPSNVGRILSALGAGAGALGTAAAMRTGTYAARNAKRIAKAIDAGKAVKKDSAPAAEVAKSTTRNYPSMKNVTLKRKASGDVEYKKGGSVKKYASGGSIDGIAQRGKTNCKMR